MPSGARGGGYGQGKIVGVVGVVVASAVALARVGAGRDRRRHRGRVGVVVESGQELNHEEEDWALLEQGRERLYEGPEAALDGRDPPAGLGREGLLRVGERLYRGEGGGRGHGRRRGAAVLAPGYARHSVVRAEIDEDISVVGPVGARPEAGCRDARLAGRCGVEERG